jgi:hypothetical protein
VSPLNLFAFALLFFIGHWRAVKFEMGSPMCVSDSTSFDTMGTCVQTSFSSFFPPVFFFVCLLGNQSGSPS